VYNQIHRLKHPVRSLTSEEEERLCQWVHRYESTHGKKRISTFDKYSCLKEVFPHQDDRIPMEQLSHYISKSQRALEQTPITANGKKIIADWIHENKRQPSQQDKQLLQQQTGLDRKQLEHQIRGIVDVKGNVTADVKEMIKDWICQHNGQAPEGPERTQLQHATGLSRKQLSDQLYLILNPKGEITPEAKEMVLDRLQLNNFSLSTEEQDNLLERTGWNRKQLSRQIRNMIKKHSHNNS